MRNFLSFEVLEFAVGNFLISSLWGFFTANPKFPWSNLDVIAYIYIYIYKRSINGNLTKKDEARIGEWLQPGVALHLRSKHTLISWSLFFSAKQSGGRCGWHRTSKSLFFSAKQSGGRCGWHRTSKSTSGRSSDRLVL